MAGDLNIAKEADRYLIKMQAKFRSYKQDWENFPDEILEKSKEILMNGVKPKVSSGRNENGYFCNVDIDLDQNKPALETYLSTVREQLREKADQFHRAIREMDGKLNYFHKNGLDEAAMKKLVTYFAQWVDYAAVLTFRYKDLKHEILLPEELLAKRQQWKNAYPDARPKTVKTVSLKQPVPVQSQAAQKEADPEDKLREFRNKRKAETTRIIVTLREEYNEAIGVIREQYDMDLKQIEDENSRIGKELSEKKRYQETLGFFQFGEKRANSNAMIQLEQTRFRLQDRKQELEDRFEQQQAALKERVEKNWERQRREIRSRFPLPQGISLYDIVLLGMDPGNQYTIEELAGFQGMPPEITPGWLKDRIIPKLIVDGKIRCGRKAERLCYWLA